MNKLSTIPFRIAHALYQSQDLITVLSRFENPFVAEKLELK